MPKALLIRNGKLRNFAYTFVTSFATDLLSYIFYEMAPPSGSVVPFVLVSTGEAHAPPVKQLIMPGTQREVAEI